MKCQYCDNPVPDNVNNCPSCGAPVERVQKSSVQPQRPAGQQPQRPAVVKNPTVAVLLSCLVVGLGQMYNGQIVKGIVLLGVSIGVCVIFPYLSCVCWVVAMIDAYKIANKLNDGKTVGEWEFC